MLKEIKLNRLEELIKRQIDTHCERYEYGDNDYGHRFKDNNLAILSCHITSFNIFIPRIKTLIGIDVSDEVLIDIIDRYYNYEKLVLKIVKW